jgi:hypothetical protein
MIIAGTLVAMNAAAQTPTGAQAGASAEHKTTVSANQSGAQANSSTNTSASGQARENSANLASGTEMQAALAQPVDAKKSKPGDSVTAKTTQAVKSDGQVIIPKGSRLVGHVTEAKARANGEAESALGIVFDKAILKNGQEVPLHASIQALAAAQSAASTSPADADLAGSGMGSAAGSTRSAGGGVLGGASSTAGGAASTVTNTSANVAGAAAGTLDSTARAAGSATGSASGAVSGTSQGAVGGLTSVGQFTSNSRGVFGLHGLNLSAAGSNSTEGSLITSAGKNVHLDSGTRMLLVAQGSAQAGSPQQQ